MTEPWLAALITAAGVAAAALIGVFGGRGRLHRIEVVARVLKACRRKATPAPRSPRC